MDGLALIRRRPPPLLVGRAILVHELPLAVDQQRVKIIVRVAAFVPGGTVAHF